MAREASIQRSPDKPSFGIQPPLPGLGLSDRPTPLLLEEKGPGDEVLWPVEQRSTTAYYTPYTFSAKERDPETGYSYFGARYYDADISVWLSVDPMSNERSWLSPYNYCQWKPVMLIDPDGRLDWIPEVEETKNNKGNVTSGKLVLRAEDGDNAKTLAKFLNVDESKANKLYATMEKGKVTPTNDVPGVSAINAAIKDYIKNSKNYSRFKFGNLIPQNYNCWESAISISHGKVPNFKNSMDRFEFREQILSDYNDVTDSPNEYKFGHTVVRFAESKYSIIHGKYSFTTHAATYLGTSKNGTQYFWSKNGNYRIPGVFTLDDLNKKYGKVEGYRAEPGGGYYNLKK
jgi:RHS repeat-associated protein